MYFRQRRGNRIDTWRSSVNDELPRLISSTLRCPEYLGYQPTYRISASAPEGGISRAYWVPILEKAWAKYLDAFQFLSSRPELSGYGTIRSSRADNVLAAITGGTREAVGRGDYTALTKRLRTCLTSDAPCVWGSGSYEAFARGDYGDGFTDESDLFLFRNNADAVLGIVQRARTSTGAVFSSHLRIYDINNQPVELGRRVRLPVKHAYAIDRANSFWSTNAKRCKVTLINPWGYSPIDCPNDTNGINKAPSTGCDGPRSFELSCGAALALTSGIYTTFNRVGPIA